MSTSSEMDINYIQYDVKKSYTTYQEAEKYLEHHKIKELFDFMMTKLIVHRPKDFILFLIELLDQCMMFRSGHQGAPLLFNKRHAHQIFKSFDICGKNSITVDQYKTAMEIFGISEFRNPTLTPEGLMTKDVFETEVMNNLRSELGSIVTVNKNDF